MCDGGTTPFIRWVVKKNGAPTGVSFDTNLSGAPYTPVGPATFGACAVPANRVIITDGITLAGPLRAATPGFTGAIGTVDVTSSIAANYPTGILMSFTVTAFNTVPGLLGLTTDQVVLNMVSLGGPDFTGSVNLNDGETRTFSVARDQDARLIASSPTVVVTGNAYAHITWTFQL
jgi:hypothetical protein